MLHTAPLFYDRMKDYLLSEDQLVENGYPRQTSQAGEASIHRDVGSQGSEIRPVGPNAVQHRCCRCSKMFIIYNSGQYQRVEDCIYHYGRLVKNRGELAEYAMFNSGRTLVIWFDCAYNIVAIGLFTYMYCLGQVLSSFRCSIKLT